MAAPILMREGARISGVTTSKASVTCRTNSSGVNLKLQVSLLPDFPASLTVTSTGGQIGALNSANNYNGTAYVTGLKENTQYYWRVLADDGAGGETIGSSDLHSGVFRTLWSSEGPSFRFGFIGCIEGSKQAVGNALTERATHTARQLLRCNLDYLGVIGDIFYSDVGTQVDNGLYNSTSWYNAEANPPATVTERIARCRSNFITTMDGPANFGHPWTYGKALAKQPFFPMIDDHDAGLNDRCTYAQESTQERKDAIVAGIQVANELFFNGMKEVIVASQPAGFDWATQVIGGTTTPTWYYHVDTPPVRFIFLDTRTWRDIKTATDGGTIESPSKKMISDTQYAWLAEKVANNPCKFLALVTPSMGDGDHNWKLGQMEKDTWKGYSFQWQKILGMLRSQGDPLRTIILSFDTHNSAVLKWATDATGSENKIPIWEVMASNHWANSAHITITGFSSEVNRSGEELTKAAVGYGATCEFSGIGAQNLIQVDAGPWGMRVSLIHLIHKIKGDSSNWTDEHWALSPEVMWMKEYT